MQNWHGIHLIAAKPASSLLKSTTMGDQNWKPLTFNRGISAFVESAEKKWKKPFFFVQGADPQFGLRSKFMPQKNFNDWEEEKLLAKALVEQINKMDPPPRFFVICGDQVNAPPYDTLRAEQIKDFKDIFGKVRKDIPVVCVCGNHDAGDIPNEETIEMYKQEFGDDYYSFICGGINFMVLNSQYFVEPSNVLERAKEHEKWIWDTLADAKKKGIKRTIIFQHIPWFLKTYNEADHVYFTLRKVLRKQWLPKLREFGVQAIFCGHYHRNSEGFFEGLPVITTSAIGHQLGDDSSGARIVKVEECYVEHNYYAIADLPLNNIF